MTPEQWTRAQLVLEGAKRHTPSDRSQYVSVACAEDQLLPAGREAADHAIVLADGFSCRTQLEQLAGRRGLHLAEVLAAGLAEEQPQRPGTSSR